MVDWVSYTIFTWCRNKIYMIETLYIDITTCYTLVLKTYVNSFNVISHCHSSSNIDTWQACSRLTMVCILISRTQLCRCPCCPKSSQCINYITTSWAPKTIIIVFYRCKIIKFLINIVRLSCNACWLVIALHWLIIQRRWTCWAQCFRKNDS